MKRSIFLVLMLAATIAYPLLSIVLGSVMASKIVAGAYTRRDDLIFLHSGAEKYESQIYFESIISVLFLGFFLYAFAMVVLVLCHLIFKPQPTNQ